MQEKDVQNIISLSRVTHLLTKVLLKPYQRQSVPLFRRYVVRDKNFKNCHGLDHLFEKPLEPEQLWDQLDLDQS